MARPIVLRADNFTPPSRTPWGGTRILARYKREAPVAPDKAAYPVVGESWEVSVEPDFPSVTEDTGVALAEMLARDPVAMLGREARTAGRTSSALLVKLLDAADELSVQIHPSDAYTGLAPGESAKPESWYVVDREPGAGVYLGIAPGVTESQMAASLESGGDVSKLLEFVPCEPGDFLLIEAGTAHAIGRGLTLVEPQHVAPGRRGVTYRYWDWNRRYDAQGRADPNGSPRALHMRDALAVTRWDAPRGAEFLRRVRVRAGAADTSGAPRLEVFCGGGGALPSEYLQVARLAGTGEAALPAWDALLGVTVLAGAIELGGVAVGAGRSFAVAAADNGARVKLRGAHAIVSAAY